MKPPTDRALLNDQLEVVPVPSLEQLAVKSMPSRTQRDEAENRVQLRHNPADALSTKPPAGRILLSDQLEIALVMSREQPLGRSQVEHNETKNRTVPSFVMTSSEPCRRNS